MFGREQAHYYLTKRHLDVPLLPKYHHFEITGRRTGPRPRWSRFHRFPPRRALLRPWLAGRLPPLAASRYSSGKQLLRCLPQCSLLRSDPGRSGAARDTLDALRLMNPDPQPRFVTRDGTEDSELKGRDPRPLSPKSANRITPRAGGPPGAGRSSIRVRLPSSGRGNPSGP